MGNRPQQPDRDLFLVRFGAERVGEHIGAGGRHPHTADERVEHQPQTGRGALHPELPVMCGHKMEAAGQAASPGVEFGEIPQPADPARQFGGVDRTAADEGEGVRAGASGHDVLVVPVAHQPGTAGGVRQGAGLRVGEAAGHGGRVRTVGKDREVRVAGAPARTWVRFSHGFGSASR